jgi:hypothetical protein
MQVLCFVSQLLPSSGKGRKVKESRDRPGVTQRITGGLGSQISMIFGT